MHVPIQFSRSKVNSNNKGCKEGSKLVNFQPWSMYGEEDGSYDLKWAVKFQIKRSYNLGVDDLKSVHLKT